MVNNSGIKFSFRNYLPSEPFIITVTGSRIFIFLLVALTLSFIFYLRLRNEDELVFLNEKHHQIEMKISNYLNNMSSAEIEPLKGKELEEKITKYRNELKMVEKNIKEIKSIWFMQ